MQFRQIQSVTVYQIEMLFQNKIDSQNMQSCQMTSESRTDMLSSLFTNNPKPDQSGQFQCIPEEAGYIHLCSPGAGADNPLGSKFSYKHKTSITLFLFCKLFPF